MRLRREGPGETGGEVPGYARPRFDMIIFDEAPNLGALEEQFGSVVVDDPARAAELVAQQAASRRNAATPITPESLATDRQVAGFESDRTVAFMPDTTGLAEVPPHPSAATFSPLSTVIEVPSNVHLN